MKVQLIPKSYLMVIVTLIFYYWNTFFEGDFRNKLAVCIFLIGVVIGRMYVKIIPIYKFNQNTYPLNNKLLIKLGISMFMIGLLGHLMYYDMSVFGTTEYAEGYLNSRGKGYITVFFDWLPLGLLIALQGSKEERRKSAVIFLLLLLITYCGFYFFILMKRRQVLLVVICLAALFIPNKIKIRNVIGVYIIGCLGYLIFGIFGRVRGMYQNSTLVETLDFVIKNFDWDWIALDTGFEGKYISMILADTMNYVEYIGLDLKVILGSIIVMIPRSLLGGEKLLAFPEWYTFNFHPYEYSQNIGYAGSIVAESYLFLSWAGILIVSFAIGYISKFIDSLGQSSYRIAYGICIYTFLIIPRLDFGSLLIIFMFSIIPTYMLIRVTTKKFNIK
ncbi:O-antigen polysaccharide polymerase Wzy [Bacillus tropicus]|uniref:O-antigen polysaccharide polymerase Wzy n=1 Tax=Bacillus tropicus TaxID=2026188 RepID=UPI0021D14102|nr:O-antigen polysaccharide polymerase Wzy [Bacillus tropicus]MCU5226647.1 O-antigen polysaccharide polymerase Wzy [Bacillus tropicus]